MSKTLKVVLMVASFAPASHVLAAQTTAPPATQTKTPATSSPGTADEADDEDAAVAALAKTPAELKEQAWTMLATEVVLQKRPQDQIQALAALGTMGASARALEMIETAMKDKDVDVRTAAALAAGQTKATTATPGLRQLLNDPEPQVAYTAALTLWNMRDRSGEDVLVAVVDGERKDSPTMVHGVEQSLYRELHDPAAIAKYGALQGAGMLLGPFGFGIAAFEYLHKNGGDVARAAAIEAIAQNRTATIRKVISGALMDKDVAVRAAAAKALGPYKDAAISPQISKLFRDPRLPVRLTAAAAYLVSTGAAPGSPPDPQYAPGRK